MAGYSKWADNLPGFMEVECVLAEELQLVTNNFITKKLGILLALDRGAG
jgi:hypothetical protein